MAAYETVIASLLTGRISQGNPDTSYGMIFDARAADAIWPGMVEVSGMSMSVNGQDPGIAVRQFLKANGFGIVGYPVVNEALDGRGTFPANNAPAWVRTKFTMGQWPAAPLYGDALNGLRGLVMGRIITNIASIPNDLKLILNQMFAIGLMVYPANANAQWLTKEDREAFAEIVSATKPVVSDYNKSRMAELATQGSILQSNADLWGTVYRITAGVATMGFSEVAGKIEEMRTKLRAFAATKKKALAAADQMAFDQRSKVYTQVATEEAKIKASLGVLYTYVPGLDADIKGEGLGAWALAGGVAAAVIIAKIILVITACGAAIYLLFKLTGALGEGFSVVGGIAGVALVGMGLFFLFAYGKKKLAAT